MTKLRRPAVLPSPLGELYTTEETAAILKVSTRTILRAIESGRLEAKKIGKGYRITREALQAYWEKAPEGAKKRSVSTLPAPNLGAGASQ